MTVLNILVLCVTLIAVVRFEFFTIGVHGTLTVSPLWDTSDRDSNQCSMLWEDQEHKSITIFGNAWNLCSLHVSANFTASVRILDDPSNEYLLFSENADTIDVCPNKAVAIYEHHSQCSAFIHRNVRLNLQGNVSIVLTELSTRLFESTKCSPYDNRIPPVNDTLEACNVVTFDRVTICDDPTDDTLCRLSFPDNCNSVLLYRQVSLSCVIDYNVHHENDLIIYPNSITTLDLTRNNLAQIGVASFKSLSQLEYLLIGFNDIHWLYPGVFIGLESLTHLYIEHNWLVYIESELFHDLTKLLVLDLTANELKVLPVEVFNTLIYLKELLLNGNKFRTVDYFKGLYDLEILDLSENQITTLPANVFEDLHSLKKLYLTDNSLRDLHPGLFRNVSNLSRLYLGDNKLGALDPTIFRGLHRLFFLKLNGNRFAHFDSELFHDLTGVFLLYLQDNRVATLDPDVFANLKSIHSINLSANNLTVLPHDVFEGLPHLDVINLGSNYIEYLPRGIFKGIVELQTLYLDNNRLHRLDKKVLADSKNLVNLILNGNNMSRIDFDIFNNTPFLATLDLSKNSLDTVPFLGGLDSLYFVNLNENDLLGVTKQSFVGMKNDLHMFASQHEVCDCYVPFGVNCSASSYRSPFLTCNRLLSDRVLVAMMWIIGLNALAGNAFVLSYKDRYNKNRVQTFICKNLAMSDLLMGVYMLVIAIADIYYGTGFPMRAETWRTGITCRIAGALSILSSEASVFFVTLISVDRFLGVIFPHSDVRFGKISIKVAVGLIWLLATILGILPSSLAGQNPNFYDNSHVCIGLPLALYGTYTKTTTLTTAGSHGMYRIEVPRWLPSGDQVGMYFSTVVFLGLNCLRYFVVAICYVCIIVTVYLSSRRVGTFNASMKTQIRLTLKVAAIVITDFMCWFPIIVLGILVQTRVLTLPPSVFAWSVTFVLPINSAINPYLYTIADAVNSRRREIKSTSKQTTSVSDGTGKNKRVVSQTVSSTYSEGAYDTKM